MKSPSQSLLWDDNMPLLIELLINFSGGEERFILSKIDNHLVCIIVCQMWSAWFWHIHDVSNTLVLPKQANSLGLGRFNNVQQCHPESILLLLTGKQHAIVLLTSDMSFLFQNQHLNSALYWNLIEQYQSRSQNLHGKNHTPSLQIMLHRTSERIRDQNNGSVWKSND